MDKHCLIGIRRLAAHMATSYQLSLYSASYSSFCISEGYWEDDKLNGRGRVTVDINYGKLLLCLKSKFNLIMQLVYI